MNSFLSRAVPARNSSLDIGVASRTRARSRSPRSRHFSSPPSLSLNSIRQIVRQTPTPPPLYMASSSSSSSSSSPPGIASTEFADSPISPPRPRRAYLEPPFNLNELMGQFLYSCPLPISQARLDTLPVIAITEEHAQQQCSICFDEFKASDSSVRQLSCNHMFHELCIFPWLRINGTCPVCRAPLEVQRQSATLSPTAIRQRNFGKSFTRSIALLSLMLLSLQIL